MLVTVVGAYPKIPNSPRPQKLRQAITRLDRGEITREELARVEDEVTAEVIAEQVAAGVDLVSDGQVRWQDQATYLTEKLAGFETTGLLRWFDTNMYYRQPAARAAVAWQRPILVRDFQFATSASAKPVKAILTGPYTLARLCKDEFYGDLERFTLDLARALNQEARALAAAGAHFIQFDEPAIARRKDDYGLFARALAEAALGLKATTALYTYFGDVESIWPAMQSLPVDVIGLDFWQGPRNWEAIRRVECRKGLAAGIVDARNTKLETAEQVTRDVGRLLEVVPSERLYVNPSAPLEFLPREVAEKKLKVLADGVKMASMSMAGPRAAAATSR